MDCGPANQTYHYGATTEVRWKPPRHGEPGQQCTYDENGNLITSGIASGSPDKVSPQGCGPWDGISYGEARNFLGHNEKDMQPWESLPCREYLKKWPANNANNCSPTNPVADIAHMPEIVGDMNCRDIVDLFNKAKSSKNISQRLKDFILGNSTTPMTLGDLKREITNWYRDEGCPSGTGCDVIRDAFENVADRK
jgi:hypothetical protein